MVNPKHKVVNAKDARDIQKKSKQQGSPTGNSPISDMYQEIANKADDGAYQMVYYYPYGLAKSMPEMKEIIKVMVLDVLTKDGFFAVFEGEFYGFAKIFISWRDDPTEYMYKGASNENTSI